VVDRSAAYLQPLSHAAWSSAWDLHVSTATAPWHQECSTVASALAQMLPHSLFHTGVPFLRFLQDEIDRWLTEAAAGPAGSGDDDASMPPSSLDPVGKRKRAAAESGERAAKVARSSGSGGTPQGAIQLDNKVGTLGRCGV
jgi:hypothetical protein